jgi:cysteine synthase A
MHYLLIESNTTGTGAIAISTLLSKRHDVTFVTRDRVKYPFLAEDAAVNVLDVDTNDRRTLTAAIEQVHTTRPIHAVVTFSTYYVAEAAAIAARLGLRSLNEQTARICHDKIATRRILHEAGLINPRFWAVEDPAEVPRAAAEVSYPCVVKPAAESGSLGVLQINSAREFFEHYRTLAARTVNDRGQRGTPRVLVEELLEGPEVSVESFTSALGQTRVLGITQKHLSAPPYFVELGHDFPAELTLDVQAAVESVVTRALDALGYDFGPAHTEVRLTPGGPVIVEVNPRMAGGMIPELVHLSTGIDFITDYLDALTVDTPTLAPLRCQHAAIRFIVSKESGELLSSPQFDDLLQAPFVHMINFFPRSFVSPPASAADRLGYVICKGEDRDRVCDAADSIAQAIGGRLHVRSTEVG